MNSFVAVTPYGWEGASARVRVLDWLDRLAPGTVVHSYAGTRDNSPRTLATHAPSAIRAEIQLRTLARARNDRVLIHRGASPFGWGGLETSILKAASFSVYDFDDALQWDGAKRRFAHLFGSNSAKCIQCIRKVDRVVAGNEVLADWAGQFARDVVVIPSCVDPSKYETKSSFELSDPPRLVWIGSSSAEKYLIGIQSALLTIHELTGARLVVVGAPNAILPELARMTDRIPWEVGIAERTLSQFDVGLAPLSDDLYSRGKCAYKVLQYAASGVPVVASSVGANTVATSRCGGLLARSSDDWVDQVMTLLQASVDERQRIASIARREVERSYSFSAWSDRWAFAVGLLDCEPSTREPSER